MCCYVTTNMETEIQKHSNRIFVLNVRFICVQNVLLCHDKYAITCQASFFLTHSCRWQWPACALAGIDIFAHSLIPDNWMLPVWACVVYGALKSC